MSSVTQQRLAQKMKQVYDSGKVKQQEGETGEAYYGRLRLKATQIMRYKRAKKRKAASAARRRNHR